MSIVGMAIGAGMVATSLVGIVVDKDLRFKRKVKSAFRKYGLVHKEGKNEYRIKIKEFYQTPYGYRMTLKLPVGVTSEMVEKKLKAIEEATFSQIKFRQEAGTICSMMFGKHSLDGKVPYKNHGDHRIPLASRFGPVYIDFENPASYHMLVGGATRMGKSKFLELVIYHLLQFYRERIQIHIVSVKITDFEPFFHIPQIHTAESFPETRQSLSEITQIVEQRKKELKAGRQEFDPLFLIVDEFARFADKEEQDIRDSITYLVETAGYLNVHVIAASQRPDATSVLPSRMRANLLVNMAFTTRDEANSKIIVGCEDAAHLGKIPGRAVLVDGFKEIVQVPYLEKIDVEEFKHYDESRQIDHRSSSPLSSPEPGSNRSLSLFGSVPTLGDSESDYAPLSSGREGDSNSAAEGPSVPLHAEPGPHSHTKQQAPTFPWSSGFVPSARET